MSADPNDPFLQAANELVRDLEFKRLSDRGEVLPHSDVYLTNEDGELIPVSVEDIREAVLDGYASGLAGEPAQADDGFAADWPYE